MTYFRTSVFLSLVLSFYLLSLTISFSAKAQYLNTTPQDLVSVGVDEKLGNQISSTIWLYDEIGEKKPLTEFILGDKPVLLNLVYFECPMLCGLVLNGLLESVNNVDWSPGKEYTILTVSIDPEETWTLASDNKRNYLDSLNREISPNGWRFLTGEKDQIQQLTNEVGFNFSYDEKTGEYAHPAALVFLDPNAKVTRYLYGITYNPIQLKKALSESAIGKIGSTVDKILLYCYQYDPSSKSYVPYAINIMKVGGLIVMLSLGLLLGILWYKERLQTNN